MNKNQSYQLPVLLYHRIIQKRKEAGRHNIFVYQNQIERQLQYLQKQGYSTITFEDIYKKKENDFSKKVILTFDDGYEDNYTLLFPLLKKHGFTAVIFLVTKMKTNEWGIREGEPALNFLTENQIKEMNGYGIEFGGHTQTHCDLLKTPLEKCKSEIENCKKDIEKITEKKTISFAYPYGAYNEDIKHLVKNAGYQFGIATKKGPVHLGNDNFEIRRIEVYARTSMFSFSRKVSGYYHSRNSFIRYLFKKLF